MSLIVFCFYEPMYVLFTSTDKSERHKMEREDENRRWNEKLEICLFPLMHP